MSDRFWPLCQIVGGTDTHKLLDCAGPFSAAENVEEEKEKSEIGRKLRKGANDTLLGRATFYCSASRLRTITNEALKD